MSNLCPSKNIERAYFVLNVPTKKLQNREILTNSFYSRHSKNVDFVVLVFAKKQ